ncbi:RBBP9/YdeN family alpha/beta hydrolase [Vibrio viridaestus]|uniref:Serine hydrolase family protein n=1 Tax=Vibrio viridaestus TaxID=2487322 RepID=A0A3N9TJC0_9VIBR|nr:alpha/beta hydrolase [Vibrio viridaestus]RQW64270.1 serine hydrolase family protein [Vibrio viridaestus]
MNSKQVFIIHGYMAKTSDHWFSWLSAELKKRNINSKILAMPDSDSPESKAWQETLTKKIDRLDKQTFIVAHSLGCISVLKYLYNQSEFELGGLFLVSGFNSLLPALPQLDKFIEETIVTEKVRLNIGRTVAFASTDDPLVPMEMTSSLNEKLDGKYIQVASAGHFLGDDGYIEFSELLHELLLAMGE